MKSSQLLLSSWLLASTATASRMHQPSPSAKALYFLDGNPSGSSVVALKIDPKTGMLSDPMRTATGGNGIIGINAMGPVTADPLFSADSIVAVGDKLFVVNSGSNTVSYLRIDPKNPWNPVPVGKPVSSGGTIPNTIAYSEKLNTACVANSGSVAGVQCYTVTEKGLKPVGSLMPLAVNQTGSKLLGPPNTVSDAVFSPDDAALFVTVKGDGMSPGYIYAFPVDKGCIRPKAVVSRPAALVVDFSMTFIEDRRAVISTPAYGASYVTIGWDFSVSEEKKITVPDQKATCWTAYSSKFDSVFLFDGGNPNITTLDPATGNTKYVITGSSTAAAALDSAIQGDFLYTLQGSPGVSVFSLAAGGATPKLVQSLDLSSLGDRAPWAGLATYP